MKECPKCHTIYDDIMNFCQKDGCQLQNVSSSPSSSADSSSSVGTSCSVNPKSPRTHPIFKTVLIIVTLICVAGLYWYFSQPVYTIYPEISKCTVKSEGESFVVPIHTDAPYSKWTATCSDTWVDITKASAGIRVVCKANSREERTAIISLECEDRETTKEVIRIVQADGRYGFANGHEYVDLGLSVKWASCNIGANCPEDYGDYFAWGDIKTKSEYIIEDNITFYKTINDISGCSSYDVACYEWGGKWRMPTRSEFDELRENTKTSWIERNGVKGRLVTSKKNGASIFLPAAGYKGSTSLYRKGVGGFYWSSTSNEDNDLCAYHLYFLSVRFDWDWKGCYCGLSVRPVLD